MLAGGFAIGAGAERANLLPGSKACPPPEVAPTFGVFWEAWNLADRHYVDQTAIDSTKLTYGAIEGMLAALGDVGHTRFLSPEELKAEQESLAGRFEGIGAHLGTRDGKPTVLAPLPGSPAERAGIRAGDVIVRVDGREVERLSTDEIVRLVRGPAGTTVTLSVLHQGDTAPVDIQVTRARIESPNVVWTITPGTRVAHMLLLQFAERSAQDLAEALRQAQSRGATAIILDLRNNPGGLRDEAIGVASHFLRAGNVLIEVDAEGRRTEYPVRPGGVAPEIPLVVLVNEGSASSAEIVAGALQDHRRGKIIGVKTAGTGTVLSIFTLSDGSAVFLGTSGWLTPNERKIWHQGIDPDILLPLPAGALPLLPIEEERLSPQEIRERDDAQLMRALEELGSPLPTR